jgi:hypothetical protein
MFRVCLLPPSSDCNETKEQHIWLSMYKYINIYIYISTNILQIVILTAYKVGLDSEGPVVISGTVAVGNIMKK